MWKLTIQDDQGTKPVVVHFVRDEYTIGRDEGNAVRLTERNISRHHARMLKQSDAWRLQDLGSYNGCYVNGARVVDMQALQHGDLIQLGDYRLSIEDDAVGTGRTDGVLTLPGRPGINTQADRLVLMAGPGAGQEFVLNADRMVLGRGEECDISINHPSVSRVHAEIRKVSEGRYEFVDLGSANGVRVNGAEMPSTLLDGRDVIELGDVFLKYLPAGEIYIAGAEEPLRPSPSVPPHRMSTSVKVAIGMLVATVAVVLGLALRGSEAPPAPIAQPGAADRLAQIMKDARTLLAKGDWEAAMQKVSSIPEGSNLRQSQEFKAIQDAWADALFDKAVAMQDATEKRSALDRIASSPSVDPARRKRAADEIEAMQRPAVNVADLPSDDMTIERAPAPPPPAPTVAAAPAVPTTHAPAPKAAPPKPATAAPKPTPAPKPEKGSGTLVRKNPFDDE
ncbi:MAG TPA: FHA domain-containing protein [Polyangiaceae bacterium]|nr:FHA domain-containing protein [Polyangiaceae bacterium]